MKMRLLAVVVLCTARATLAQPCSVSYISIETTTPGLELVEGCYSVSLYAGTSETLVYTIGGADVDVGGSPAILAKQVTTFYGRGLCFLGNFSAGTDRLVMQSVRENADKCRRFQT